MLRVPLYCVPLHHPTKIDVGPIWFNTLLLSSNIRHLRTAASWHATSRHIKICQLTVKGEDSHHRLGVLKILLQMPQVPTKTQQFHGKHHGKPSISRICASLGMLWMGHNTWSSRRRQGTGPTYFMSVNSSLVQLFSLDST